MKGIIKTLTIACVAAVSVSCGGVPSTSSHAESICDCMNEVGLEEMNLSKLSDRSFQRETERAAEEILPPCLLKVAKEMNEDIDALSKDDKVAYTRSFLKDIIDTDCSEKILSLMPFDAMGLSIGLMEKEIEKATMDKYNF